MTLRKAMFIAGLFCLGLFISSPGRAGEIKGKVAIHGLRSPENIAVYVEAVAGKDFPAPSQHQLMDQKKMTFVPHVLVVQKGATVDFLNSDPVGHNVYWPFIGKNRKLSRNLGTWPQGQKKSFQFNDLGAVPLLCNVHPEMSGYIIVVPTPYFTLTDREGNFTIKNIPPGHYTLTTWSEAGKPATQAVDVSAGTATVELTVKR